VISTETTKNICVFGVERA